MNTYVSPLSELNQHLTDDLIQEVGVVDTIRFLNQFRTGHSDDTAEREGLFQGMAAKDSINGIKARRKREAASES